MRVGRESERHLKTHRRNGHVAADYNVAASRFVDRMYARGMRVPLLRAKTRHGGESRLNLNIRPCIINKMRSRTRNVVRDTISWPRIRARSSPPLVPLRDNSLPFDEENRSTDFSVPFQWVCIPSPSRQRGQSTIYRSSRGSHDSPQGCFKIHPTENAWSLPSSLFPLHVSSQPFRRHYACYYGCS